jgi:hypothetical protein
MITNTNTFLSFCFLLVVPFCGSFGACDAAGMEFDKNPSKNYVKLTREEIDILSEYMDHMDERRHSDPVNLERLLDCVKLRNRLEMCQVLDFSECNLITNKRVHFIVIELCKSANLEVIILDNCIKITNNGLWRMARFLYNLKGLSFLGCSMITPDGVDEMWDIIKKQQEVSKEQNGEFWPE